MKMHKSRHFYLKFKKKFSLGTGLHTFPSPSPRIPSRCCHSTPCSCLLTRILL